MVTATLDIGLVNQAGDHRPPACDCRVADHLAQFAQVRAVHGPVRLDGVQRLALEVDHDVMPGIPFGNLHVPCCRQLSTG
jgi:hypothetical protein